MRIVIIGPGIMPIPPLGWGAVEIIIHEYRVELERKGCDVLVVNTRDKEEIIEKTNAFKPDFVHCQYDELIDVMGRIECPAKAITSHFGYLDQVWKHPDYAHKIHAAIVRSKDVLIFALSPSIAETYRQDGVTADRLFVIPNGVSSTFFRFTEKPLHPDRSIYLAKIDYRKRQGTFQSYGATIDFAGNLCPHTAQSSGFDRTKKDYLGEWSKEDVYKRITDYANLVLLSDGEAHPLVCMEAMSAGLGLVLSQYATANLDLTKPFIDVIPESKINDKDYVRDVIEKNRIKSIESRSAIRAYAEEFAWDRIVQRYLETVTNIVRDKKIERSVSVMKKPSLAIVTIATGQYYDLFFNDFEASVVAQWSPHCDIKIYCFTDHPGSGNATTEVVSVRHMGWPFDTLLRYHLMASILDRLMAHDYILYLDADMIIKHSLDPQIFAHDLVAVQHPGFRTNPEAASFEIDVVASSFVPKEKRKHYVQGCFWGGKPFALKELLLTLTQKIDTDLGRGQVPIWHDESYLNWFLADKPFLLVSAAYAFPEGSDLPFDPIIIHRAKNHDVVRSADIKGLTAEQLMRGVSLEERAKNDRLLYLRAHEKNQALERYLLEASSKVSELLDEVAWLHARTVRARLKRFLKRAVKWIGRQITLLRKS